MSIAICGFMVLGYKACLVQMRKPPEKCGYVIGEYDRPSVDSTATVHMTTVRRNSGSVWTGRRVDRDCYPYRGKCYTCVTHFIQRNP